MGSIAEFLPEIKNKDFYFYINKENPDWISEKSLPDLIFHFSDKKVSLSTNNEEDLSYLCSSLYHFIDSKNIIISWSSKDIFTYLKGKTNISLEVYNFIYDLSLLSSYFAIQIDRPESFKDSIRILKKILSDSCWKKFSKFYSEVYIPLFSKVLPDIETNCLTDNKRKICVYPNYIMEGQINGRLSTLKLNKFSYNPHSLGPEEKNNLRPSNYDDVFVYFDYKNMEVNVLQWLSGDKELEKILNSEKDIYKGIWKKITKQEATDSHRALCKRVFLPVVFGLGKTSLSKKLGISEESASKLIDSLVRSFPVAFDWVKSQSVDSNNIATDIFGRKRKFEDNELYKIRNFCIQSPASMICLRKLVRLYEFLQNKANICYHVHDGYCITCNKNEVSSIYDIAKKALDEEDDFFPGLKLKTTCQYGQRLDNLKTFTKEKEVLL